MYGEMTLLGEWLGSGKSLQLHYVSLLQFIVLIHIYRSSSESLLFVGGMVKR